MKKSLVARGFVGAVASLLGVAAVGCGADVGGGAAGDSAEIGSSEQAIRIAHACDNGVSDLSDSSYSAKYAAYVPISSTEVLVLGGFNSLGNAITTVKKYNKNSDTWTTMASLNAARGEPGFMLLGGTRVLILGGKSSTATKTELDNGEIYDWSVNNAPSPDGASTTITDTMASKRTRMTISQLSACASSKYLIAGGLTTNGVNESVVDTLEVFSYDSTTPANSTFDILTNRKTPNADNVTLTTARQYHSALPFNSGADVFVVGGEDAAGTVYGTVEKVSVTSVSGVCKLDSTTLTHPAAGTSLPSSGSRSRAAFVPVSFSISSTTYPAILAAGWDNSGAKPVTTFAFDPAGSSGAGSWTAATSLGANRGRTLPAIAINGNDFALVGGDTAPGAAEVSTDKVDYFSANAWTTTPALCTGRLGAWAAYIDGTYIAGHGRDTVGASFPSRPE